MESIGDKMIYYILGLLVFIIVLMVIVAVHEGGHFLIAKKSGILCHEYSLGMGPAIFQKKRKNDHLSRYRLWNQNVARNMNGERRNKSWLSKITRNGL